jgi:hypothetical protein
MTNNNIIKLSSNNLSDKRRQELEEQNYENETIKGLKERGWVCRLPYPLTLSSLIDIAERLGIMNEKKVIPGLYNLRNEIEEKIREIPEN